MHAKPDIRNYEDITLLIRSFYTKALQDDVIGIFFTDIAHINLAEHLPIMYRFWDSLLFQARTYHGQVMHKHISLHAQKALEPHHFARWLALFHATVDEHFTGPNAERARERATAIAMTMRTKLSTTQLPLTSRPPSHANGNMTNLSSSTPACDEPTTA